MKAFIAFVVILFLAIGVIGGFWAWKKWTKVEEWGLALPLSSTLADGEVEKVGERYNVILDQDDVLMGTVEEHGLSKYYGVSSNEEAVALFKEDSFIRIHGNNTMHILFVGKRSSRDERMAAVRTLSQDFLKKVQSISGQ